MAIKFQVDEKQKELDKKHKSEIAKGNTDAKKQKAELNYTIVKDVDKTPLQKWRKVIFIISCVSLFIALIVMIAPALAAFFGIFLGFIWFIIVLIATGGTVGLIWLSDGFKNFERKLLDATNAVFAGSAKIVEIVQKIFPIVAPICAAFVVASFTLCTICFAKKKENNTAYFVVSSIIFALFLTFTIISAIYYYK